MARHYPIVHLPVTTCYFGLNSFCQGYNRQFGPIPAIIVPSSATRPPEAARWERGRRRTRRETPMAAGEAPIKQAVKWLDEQLRDHPSADRLKLVDEASRRFDLTPLDADFLLRQFGRGGKTA